MGMMTKGAPLLTAGAASLYSDDAEANWVTRLIDNVPTEVFNMWHGGRDWGSSTRYDPNMAGSGEGNAAFSHGLYGADAEGVSRGYAKIQNRGDQLDDQDFLRSFGVSDYERGEVVTSYDNARKIAGPSGLSTGNTGTLSYADRLDILDKVISENNASKRMIEEIVDAYDIHSPEISIESAMDDYAFFLTQDGNSYDFRSYMEPTWLPEENMYEPPITENLAEALKMAENAMKRDGISNDHYSKMKALSRGRIDYERALVYARQDLESVMFMPDGPKKDALLKVDKARSNLLKEVADNKTTYSEVLNKINILLESADPELKELREKAKQSKEYSKKVTKEIMSAFHTPAKKGWLYGMDIPQLKRENFLMWDYSLSQQPKIKAKIQKVVDEIGKMDQSNWDSYKELAYESLQDIMNGKEFTPERLKELQQVVRVSAKEMNGVSSMDDIGAGNVVWLLEEILPQKKVAQLMSEAGIQASSHLNRASRKDFRTTPFNQRDIKDADNAGEFNHVIYDNVDIDIISREQIGNADPRLLAAIAASGTAASAAPNAMEAMRQGPYIDAAAGMLSGALQGVIDTVAPTGRPMNPWNPTGQYGKLKKEQLEQPKPVKDLKKSVTFGSKAGQFIGGMLSPI